MTKRYLCVSGGADSVAALNTLVYKAARPEDLDFEVIWVEMVGAQHNMVEKSVIHGLAQLHPGITFRTMVVQGIGAADVLAVALTFINTVLIYEEDNVELMVGFKDKDCMGDHIGCGVAELQFAVDRIIEAYREIGWPTLPNVTVSSPILGMTKKEVMQAVGTAPYWSCRNPYYNIDNDMYHPCGKCHSCKEVQEQGGYQHRALQREIPRFVMTVEGSA